MAIIVSRNGSPTQVVKRSEFEKESSLQEFIEKNPESIPIYQIEDGKRLFVAAREFQTDAGPIDAFGVDKDGDVYIIETKLFTNSDKRRVVAQALDYGASLWKHSGGLAEIETSLNTSVREEWGRTFQEKLSEVFCIEADQAKDLVERVKANVHEGKLKFVIPMDHVDEPLKDLITYINHNSQFDIYAVQLERYVHDGYEIAIPKLFGVEVRKGVGLSPSRPPWNEQEMREYARTHLKPEEWTTCEKIYNFAKENTDEMNFGTASYPSFSPIFRKLTQASLFTLALDDKRRLSLNYKWVADESPELVERYKSALERNHIQVPEDHKKDYKGIRPSLKFERWKPKVSDFLVAIRELLETDSVRSATGLPK